MKTWMPEAFREEIASCGLVGQVDGWNRRFARMSPEDAEISVKNNRVGAYVRFEGGGGSFRVIGQFVEVSGTTVFCWLRVVHRNKSECAAFYAKPREWGQAKLQHIIDAELDSIQADIERGVEDDGGLEEGQANAALFSPWLERPRFTDDDGERLTIVYEAVPWAAAMRVESVRLHWAIRLSLLKSILDGDLSDCTPVPGVPEVLLARREGRGLVCLKLQPEANASALHAPAVVLVGALGPDAPSAPGFSEERLIGLARKIRDAWHAATSTSDRLDAIAAHASRCYPEILTWDDDLWLAVEQDPTANLALSAEEEELLQGIASDEEGRPGLPLFLHGRAGSGKSTMLARVFADYFYRWSRERLPGRPIFLTLSDSLLDRAKEEVRQLLSANHSYLTRGQQEHDSDELDQCFRSFGDLLAEGVAEIIQEDEERKAHFRGEDRVSFSVFKQLYTGENLNETLAPHRCLLPERDRIAPELAWHVIRTFLKGWSVDGPLDVEAYKGLPRRDRTVSAATFERIYKTIWSGWYRDLTSPEGPLWDDQDRIGLILAHDWIPIDYTALFCDESQDFTRIELEWILRLSVLGRLARFLPAGMPCLPFMFAGDPLQTLNPTGFRWAALKATFTEQLRRLAGKDGTWTPSFEQLHHNYRSAQEVVKVVNLLQLWRARTLKMRDVAPQRAWSREQGSATLWVLDQNTTTADLRQHLADAIVIVPAEECGEDAYVERHPGLSQNLLKSGGRYAGVFTALGAKGLEFDRVVVFGFGDSAPDDVLSAVSDSDEGDIEKAHFFNKLYVAASRARKELVILDTQRGFQRLWERARRVEAALDGFDRAEQWRHDVGELHLGTRGEMQYARMDPRVVADTLFQSGLRDRDPDHLLRAKQFYDRAGEPDGVAKAEAWRLRYMGSFEAAGSAFLQLDQVKDALDCFWQGGVWGHLDSWFRQHPPARPTSRAVIAAFYASTEPRARRLDTLARDLGAVGSDLQVGADRERWERFVDDVGRMMDAPLDPPLAKDGWIRLAGALQDLGVVLSHALNVAGLAWYKARQPADAVRCWDLCSRTSSEEYLRAKAASTPLPERLAWLEKLGDWPAIVSAWDALGHPDNTEWSGPAAAALLHVGRALEAARLFVKMGRWNDAAQVLGRQDLKEEDRITLALTLVAASLESGRYDTSLQAMRTLEAAGRQAEVVLWEFRAMASIAARKLRPQDPAVKALRPAMRRHLFERRDWPPYLDLRVAGWLAESYLELKYSDLQQLYRPFLEAESRGVRLFAQQRYLNALHARAQLDEAAGRTEQAIRFKAEVQQREKEWGLPASWVDALPDPPLGLEEALALEPVEEVQDKEDLRDVPGYDIKRLQDPPVIAITFMATLESVRIDVARRVVRGAGVAKGQPLRGGATYFLCDDLKLRVEFEPLPRGGVRVNLNIAGHDRAALFPAGSA